jgi:hypothetical protein
MQARWYLAELGRFISADTIIPQPADPQSHNRYSYTVNRPLVFVDPSGHNYCSDPDGSCDPDGSLPAPPPPGTSSPPAGTTPGETPPPLVDFEGDFIDAEKAVIEAAAWDVAQALAAAHNAYLQELWELGLIDAYTPITPRQAFLLVYGGTVTFVRHKGICNECYGETISAREVWVYTQWNNADGIVSGVIVTDKRFIVHELGHAFENALEEILGFKPPRKSLAAVQQNTKWNFPNRGGPTKEDYGFAGPYPGWQQSQDYSAGEELADMFLGWVYGRWGPDYRGFARGRFMTNNMPEWVVIAVYN